MEPECLHGAFFGFSGVFWGRGNCGMGNCGQSRRTLGEARGKLWVKKGWTEKGLPSRSGQVSRGIHMYPLTTTWREPPGNFCRSRSCSALLRDDDGARLGSGRKHQLPVQDITKRAHCAYQVELNSGLSHLVHPFLVRLPPHSGA